MDKVAQDIVKSMLTWQQPHCTHFIRSYSSYSDVSSEANWWLARGNYHKCDTFSPIILNKSRRLVSVDTIQKQQPRFDRVI